MLITKKFHNTLRILSSFVFSVVLLVVLCSDLGAAETVRIVTIQLPPFGFFTEDGASTGLLYELGNRIAEEAGFEYENQILPFARVLHELENGNADFGLFFQSEKNDDIVIQVSRVLPFKNVVIGANGAQFDSLESLHGKLVARVRGARYDEAFAADAAIKKIDTNDYQESIKVLFKKRVDAIIGPEIGLLFAAKQLGYSRKDFGDPLVLNTKDGWLQYSKAAENDQKIAALKAATKKLSQDGIISNLVKKYTGE